MHFSAPVGAVHERAGDDGSNAVHSGSCCGALWWSLWYSSVAGQCVPFFFAVPWSCSLVTCQVQSAERHSSPSKKRRAILVPCPSAVKAMRLCGAEHMCNSVGHACSTGRIVV
ncbi:hypothetical protein VPH35_052230 [Triticum aestivum]